MDKNLLPVVEKAVQGDREAFGELYRAVIDSIMLQAIQITCNYHEAEDIAQNIVLKIYTNIHTLRNPNLFNVWVHRMIINECNSMFKKKYIKKKRVVAIEDVTEHALTDPAKPSVNEWMEDQEQKQAVLNAINDLPLKYRQPMLLFYYNEMKTETISEVLGVNHNTVRNRLRKARSMIEQQLEKAGIKQFSSVVAVGLVIQQVLQSQLNGQWSAERRDLLFNSCDRALDTLSAANMPAAPTAAKIAPFSKWLALAVVFLGILAVFLIDSNESLPGSPEYPQRSELEQGDDDLDIDVLQEKPVTSNTQAGEQGNFAPVRVSLYGNVFLINNGLISNDFGKNAEALQIYLLCGDKVLAATSPARDGAYEFGEVMLYANTEYEMRIIAPEQSLYAPADANQAGITISESDTQLQNDLYLFYGESSLVFFAFSGADCDCGHVNPATAALVSRGLAELHFWEIVSIQGGEPLYTGTQTTISEPFAQMQENGEQGVFCLRFEYTDVLGHTLEGESYFRMYPYPVSQNQFG